LIRQALRQIYILLAYPDKWWHMASLSNHAFRLPRSIRQLSKTGKCWPQRELWSRHRSRL